jgi:two-component system, LuxR family, sensor kinase FixL
MQPTTESTEKQKSMNIQQYLSDGYILCDATKNHYPITFVSDNFCQLTGYSKTEIIGKSCSFLQGKDTSKATILEIRNCLIRKKQFKGKILNYRKNGTQFWNLLRITPLTNEHNDVIQFIGVQTQFSPEEESKRETTATTQLELEHAHSILSNISDTAKIGIFRADATGFIISADKTCEAFVNKKEHDLLGDAWINALHHDDKASMIEKWVSFIDSNKRIHIDTYRVINSNKTLTLRTHASKQYDINGQVISITAFVVDITNNDHNNHERYNSLSNHIHHLAPIGIYEMSTDGELTYCNPHMKVITGENAKSAVQEGWQKSVHPDDIARITIAWETFLKNDMQTPYAQQLRLIVDKTTKHIRTTCFPIYINKQLSGFIGCMLDITEQESQRKTLKDLQQKNHIIANISDILYLECNAQGVILSYNDTEKKTFEHLQYDNLIGTNWIDLIHKKYKTKIIKQWKNTISPYAESLVTDDHYQLENINSQHSTYVNIDITQKSTHAKSPTFIIVMRDISTTIHQQHHYQTLEKRFRQTQNESKTGSWEWNMMDNSVWWSEETYRLFELDSRQISSSFETYMNCLTPDSQRLIKQQIDQILKDHQPYEHQITIKANPEKILHGKGDIVFNNKGEPTKLTGTITDITEQAKAEQQHINNAQRLEEITSETAEILSNITSGNLNHKFSAKHKYHPIIMSCKQLNETLKQFSTEVVRVAKEVGVEGKLGGQANLMNASGIWAKLTENVNLMAKNLTTQVREINKYAEYLADGVLDYNLEIESPGEIKQLVTNLKKVQKNINNAMSSAKKITNGDFDAQVIPVSEYDVLGITINNMTKSLKAKTEKLSEHSTVLNEFLSNTRDIFIRLNNQHDILYLSDSFYTLTDNQFKDLIGENITKLSKELDQLQNHSHKNESDTLKFNIDLNHSSITLEAAYWPVRNVNNEIKEYHIVARNISKQEKALARNNLLITSLNNIEPFFAIAKYPSTEIIWTNKESKRSHIREFHSNSQFERFNKTILPAILKYNFWQGEWGMLNENGNEHPALATCTLHCDQDNQPQYLSAMMTDISKQKIQEKESKLRQQQLNRLTNPSIASLTASTIAHQINQPLASISSTLQLWESEINSKLKINKACLDCKTASSIRSMIDKTLNMGQLIHHINSVIKQSEYIADWSLIKTICQNAQENATQSDGHITIQLNISDELLNHTIFIDAVLMTQIISNMITNSIDAINESLTPNGLIRITCFMSSKNLQIQIEDNGTGIKDNRQESIFEAFYSTKAAGCGIGLSWAKSTIETMGGTITLQEKGKTLPGAFFMISVPVELQKKTS